MLSKVSVQMAKDDKFSSKFRMVSRESSLADPSLRSVYYGVAPGAVPFLWESQPGTPKHAASDVAPLPPLTSPPAYFSIPARSLQCPKKPSKSSYIIGVVLPKISLRKSTSASSSSTSTTASSLVSCTPAAATLSSTGPTKPASPMSSYSSRGEDDESDLGASPTSTLCFGGWRRAGGSGRSVVPVKSAHRASASWV